MAKTTKVTGTPAGTGGTSAQSNNSLPNSNEIVGYVDPIVGRVAHRDVLGYFGFPLIRKGETVTREMVERAQNLSRLFELQAATEIE
jgi:arginine/lysine/ornithine decarboxylase